MPIDGKAVSDPFGDNGSSSDEFTASSPDRERSPRSYSASHSPFSNDGNGSHSPNSDDLPFQVANKVSFKRFV